MKEHQNRLDSMAVFCGSSDGLETVIYEAAYKVGTFFSKKGIEVIYGGSRLGLMGQVAKGILENNGRVTGVIPEFLKTKEVVHTGLTKLVTTRDMHERKMKMHELSDGFIALPGGFGTLEELFEILTWGQLGLHRKPVGILNVNGYYDDLIELMKNMVRKGLLKKENLDLVLIAETIEELYEKMRLYKPIPVQKWMNNDQT